VFLESFATELPLGWGCVYSGAAPPMDTSPTTALWKADETDCAIKILYEQLSAGGQMEILDQQAAGVV